MRVFVILNLLMHLYPYCKNRVSLFFTLTPASGIFSLAAVDIRSFIPPNPPVAKRVFIGAKETTLTMHSLRNGSWACEAHPDTLTVNRNVNIKRFLSR